MEISDILKVKYCTGQAAGVDRDRRPLNLILGFKLDCIEKRLEPGRINSYRNHGANHYHHCGIQCHPATLIDNVGRAVATHFDIYYDTLFSA